MKKWLIIFMLMLSVAVVADYNYCADGDAEIGEACLLVTPVLDCTAYNYTIYNVSGVEVANDELTPFTAGMYYFNFTMQEGNYVVKLCDNSTKEITSVVGDDDMSLYAVIVLLPLILGIASLVGAITLNPEHNVLKVFLYLLSLVFPLASFQLAIESIGYFYEVPVIIESLALHLNWYTWVFYIIVIYFIINYIIKVFNYLRDKKDNEVRFN